MSDTVTPAQGVSSSASQPTISDRLVELAEDAAQKFFHDSEHRSYAVIEVEGHVETWPIRERQFELLLRQLYYRRYKKSPSALAVADALGTLEGKARFDGEQASTWTRVAGVPGAIYLDLADDAWQAVQVTSSGWSVVPKHPVHFRRTAGMEALPTPVRGGNVEDLAEFVNVGSDDDFKLLIAWMLSALRPPQQPFPILALFGEQGSAKSTTTNCVRSLIDPNTAPLRAASGGERDLAVTASAGWVLVLDNLSGISPWLSDALCRISTGGGFATRELYTNDGERIFDVKRPIILNGIDELGSRSDLLDRSVLLNLPPISEKNRRTEADLHAAFEAVRPRILGALLDALAGAMDHIHAVHLPELPRMADFARWSTAAEEPLGWTPGSFMSAYDQNRAEADRLALESSPTGHHLLAVGRSGFEGNATELLALLNERDSEAYRTPGWPKTAKKLASDVKRLAPNLRKLGVSVGFERTNGKRLIVLQESPSVTTVTSVTHQEGSELAF